MRALKFITGHMVYNLAYTQILQMTETDLTKLSQCLEYQKAQKFHIKLLTPWWRRKMFPHHYYNNCTSKCICDYATMYFVVLSLCIQCVKKCNGVEGKLEIHVLKSLFWDSICTYVYLVLLSYNAKLPTKWFKCYYVFNGNKLQHSGHIFQNFS